jgi:hypothetical protein
MGMQVRSIETMRGIDVAIRRRAALILLRQLVVECQPYGLAWINLDRRGNEGIVGGLVSRTSRYDRSRTESGRSVAGL